MPKTADLTIADTCAILPSVVRVSPLSAVDRYN